MEEPAPILVDGLQEQVIDGIIDAKKVRNSYKYLVIWRGFGPGHDEWLPANRLEDCEALDRRIEGGTISHLSLLKNSVTEESHCGLSMRRLIFFFFLSFCGWC